MFCKDSQKKDTGMILLGFATLMFGMDTMSSAVSGLKNVPQFVDLFLAFQHPVLGVLAGAVLTAIIQSSSASVGILQALAMTGAVSYAAAIPIIMGQNIGTTVTAMLSSIGTNKNARRAAVVHLMFNVNRRRGRSDALLPCQADLRAGDLQRACDHVRHRAGALRLQHSLHSHASPGGRLA